MGEHWRLVGFLKNLTYKSSATRLFSTARSSPKHHCASEQDWLALWATMRSPSSEPRPFGRARSEVLLMGERSKWAYYNKPATLLGIGVLLFLSGISLSAMYFAHAEEVPSALGPVCLSIGLMFFVTGTVWLLVVKQAVRYDGLLSKRTSASGV
uniref:Uncharacterized protein n=1 Tax=Varanus komodoensis TaxID=61221 RepID=A0A8D2JGT0_VARKO